MVQLIDTVAFSAAAAAAGWSLWLSVAPQWGRILRVAAGQADPMSSPLDRLARAERRIAVRARVTPSRAGSIQPGQPTRRAAA